MTADISTPTAEPPKPNENFVKTLQCLKRNRPALMTLRSSLRFPSGIAPGVYPLIGQVLPDRSGSEQQQESRERSWVLVAALFGTWHTTPHTGKHITRNGLGNPLTLGGALQRLRSGKQSGEYEMRALTRFRLDQSRNSIHKAVLLLAKENIEPGWELLLRDLTGDDYAKAQRGWAFDYYRVVGKKPATANSTTSTPTERSAT